MHKFLWIKKLFTLKRSRFIDVLPLKRSRVYAETLPLSIYSYINLYKRSCSYLAKTVDNFFLKKFKKLILFVLVTISFMQLSACQHVIKIPINSEKHLDVIQERATNGQPTNFYICGGNTYPCVTPTAKWQAKRSA